MTGRSKGFDPFATGAVDRIDATLVTWPGVSRHPHEWGGNEYRRAGVELGHFHPTDGRFDVLVGPEERDRRVELGLGEPDIYAQPEDGWLTVRPIGPEGENAVLDAFGFAYRSAVAPRD